jgi:hypothetical protein
VDQNEHQHSGAIVVSTAELRAIQRRGHSAAAVFVLDAQQQHGLHEYLQRPRDHTHTPAQYTHVSDHIRNTTPTASITNHP